MADPQFDKENPVIVGDPTKVDDYDTAFDNILWLQKKLTGAAAFDDTTNPILGHGHTGSPDGIPIETAAIAAEAVTPAKLDPSIFVKYSTGTMRIASGGGGSDQDIQTVLDNTIDWTNRPIHIIFNLAIKEDPQVDREIGTPLSWVPVGSTTYDDGDGYFDLSTPTFSDTQGGQAEYSFKVKTTKRILLQCNFSSTPDNLFIARIYANGSGDLELEFHREGPDGAHANLDWAMSFRALGL